MTTLPVHEQILVTLKELVEPDAAFALRPIVDRLCRILRDDGAAGSGVYGDPDGFDGLTRRGSLERLVASEWALLDEVEDEFFRRFIMHEQAYYALARTDTTVKEAMCVVVDLSPRTSGALRVCVLAAWLILAERAARAGRAFHWHTLGADRVIERPPESADVLTILNRCDAVDDQALSQTLFSGERAWFVGDGPMCGAIAAIEPRYSTVSINDTFEIEPQAQVSVSQRRAPATTLTVVLPGPDEVRRLAAGRRVLPRADTSPPGDTSFETTLTPMIVDRGRRVLALLKDGGVYMRPVPTSANGHVGNQAIIRLPRGHRPIGVGWDNRHAQLLAFGDGALHEHTVGKRGGTLGWRRFDQGPEPVLRGPFLGPYVNSKGWFQDAAGNIYELRDNKPSFLCEGLLIDGRPERAAFILGRYTTMDGTRWGVLRTWEQAPQMLSGWPAIDLSGAVVSQQSMHLVTTTRTAYAKVWSLDPATSADVWDFSKQVEEAGGTLIVGAAIIGRPNDPSAPHQSLMVYNPEKGAILRVPYDGKPVQYARLPVDAWRLVLHRSGVYAYFGSDGELRFGAGGPW